jgi:two-component system, NtrC family, response regulator AtoC
MRLPSSAPLASVQGDAPASALPALAADPVGWPSWHTEPMAAVSRMIRLVGPTDVTVLVLGETGVGKEMVARALHQRSPRRDHPFVKINCAAMPLDLLESELFGYERGAFTGAGRRKPGKFEQATAGTIFLDEIGEIPLPLQAKLLHVLQDGRFSPLGATADAHADARVIAATNRDLRARVDEGAFREDLFYRLSVINIRVPPLRDRPAEIPVLLEYFLATCAAQYGRSRPVLTAADLDRMLAHAWPGNVRELENVIRRLVVLGPDLGALDQLGPSSLSLPPRPDAAAAALGPSVSPPPAPTLAEIEKLGLSEFVTRARGKSEREALQTALIRARWRRDVAARLLKVSYSTVVRKMREHGLGS